MRSSVRNSLQTIAINIEFMRAFLLWRDVILSHKNLTIQLVELKNKADFIVIKHDTIEHNIRIQQAGV